MAHRLTDAIPIFPHLRNRNSRRTGYLTCAPGLGRGRCGVIGGRVRSGLLASDGCSVLERVASFTVEALLARNDMTRWSRCATVLAVLLLGFAQRDRADAQVTVMTQNLYVGFDIEQYATDLAANLGDVVALTTAAYEHVLATDFPTRAAAIAREVERTHPALIGLQEVAWFRSASFDGFGPPHATTTEVDFLQITLDALAARGLPYAAAAVIENGDAEFPRLAGFDAMNEPIIQDIRLTDRDVILARTDLPAAELQIGNAQQANFANAASLLGVSLPRGWVSVDVQAGSLGFRLLSTHLDNDAALQIAQANELLGPGSPSDTSLPLVFVGDYNSPADGTGSPTYANLIAGGFQDAWTATHPGEPGNTWGQNADLLNPVSQLSQRIDLVLLGGGMIATSVDVVGEELADRTPTGLWPSDHAGVVATLVPEPSTLMLALIGPAVVALRRAIRRCPVLLQLKLEFRSCPRGASARGSWA
jgi:hypothetical protein